MNVEAIHREGRELISFVIPCYHSEGSVGLVIDEIRRVVAQRPHFAYQIIAVNDCSPDNLLSVIRREAQNDPAVTAIDLAKNGGRHNALICGCHYADGDYIVFIDDDQQCPADRLWDLMAPVLSGEADVSIAKYPHKTQSGFKNFGSAVNDAVATWLLGKDKNLKFSNFSVMRRFVKDEVIKYKNPYPYLSGLMLRATKRVVNVEMQERERTIGVGHYSFRKSFALWLNSFTAFSVKPLRIATTFGILFAFLGVIMVFYTVIHKFLHPQVAIGYSSLMSVLLFIGGMLMFMLGLIGEYVGRIYISLNNSPQFVIREIYSAKDSKAAAPQEPGARKDKILIIGAGDFQLPLVQKASESYDVLLAAPVISEAFTPYISDKLIVDVRDKEAILAYAQANQICGVTTDQTDIAVRSVAYVAEKMGLPGIGYETGCLFTDKNLMREKLKQLGIPILPFRTVTSVREALDFYEEIGGQVIIKPLDTQGSRGVQVCRSADEIKSKYDEAARWSSNHNVIVERFATGREFVVEGLSLNYEFRNLCIGDTLYFDLPDAFAAKSRIFPTTADDALAQRVLDLNTRIITGFGLRQGLTHSEYIMDGDQIYLIETAARGGGVFISSDLIHYSCTLNTEQFLLDIATGKQKDLPQILPQQCICGYMAFYIPTGTVVRADGVEDVLALPYVHRNQLDKLHVGLVNKEGHTDKTSRLCLILTAPDRKTYEARARRIRQMLQVETRAADGSLQPLIWE